MNKNFNIKKYTLGSLGLVVVMGLIFASLPINIRSNGHSTEGKYVLSDEQMSSLNLDDENIKSLLDLYNKNDSNIKKDDLVSVLKNVDLIPPELIKLAAKNNEALDFVSNYPSHENTDDISIEDDYTPGEIPLFLQWDERWGYSKYADEFMAINGCAPTSLAMVIVGLTGDTSLNPKVVADYSYNNGFYEDGVGTSWDLMVKGANHFGIDSKYLYINKPSILSSIKKGNVVVASVKPGIFTTTGHFLIVIGIDENGKLIINDPNSKINSSTTWDVDVFLNEVKALWEMSV